MFAYSSQSYIFYKSIHNATKEVVELTEGRLDLLLHAAGSRGDPALKIWELQGSELEIEVCIAFLSSA